MRKNGLRPLWSLLCCVILLGQTALAAGGGTLTLQYSRDGVRFDIYRAAEAVNGADTLSGVFSDYPVEFPGGNWRDTAATLAAYAARDGLEGTAAGRTSGGGLTFRGLEAGLYLVVGETYSAGSTVCTPVPFLVEIKPGGAVTAYVKSDMVAGEGSTSCTVRKVWTGESEQDRPAVTVQLLRNGTLYDTVTLDAEHGWQHTWNKLDSGAYWQVTEGPVPEGCTVSISRSGYTFTVTNTQGGIPGGPDTPDIPGEPDPPDNPDGPGEPEGPSLPQTGQLWWPVPVMGAAGLLLAVAGGLRRRGG